MTRTFVDTSFYLALLQPSEGMHPQAVRALDSVTGELVTSEFVLLELGNALSGLRHRDLFIDLVATLRDDPNHRVISVSPELLDSAICLFRDRPDKSWSLTDCSSFVIMQRMGIRDALSGDHHFRQAGFVPLLDLAS